MINLSKRSTIYFDPDIHRALKLKALSNQQSISELVNFAVQLALKEDHEDLAAFEDRVQEKTMTYEVLLKDLSKHGKL